MSEKYFSNDEKIVQESKDDWKQIKIEVRYVSTIFSSLLQNKSIVISEYVQVSERFQVVRFIYKCSDTYRGTTLRQFMELLYVAFDRKNSILNTHTDAILAVFPLFLVNIIGF